MRPICRIAFALFLSAPLALPALAAEPESPDALIGRTEAIRAAIQEQLSAKFTNASEAGRPSKGPSSNIIPWPRTAFSGSMRMG